MNRTSNWWIIILYCFKDLTIYDEFNTLQLWVYLRGCIMELSIQFFRTPYGNVFIFERIAIESAGEHNSSPVVWLTEIEVQIWRIIIQWDWINETKLCLMSSLWPATSQPRPGPGQPALGIPPQHNRFIKILFSREGNVIKWQMINCRSLCKNVRKI